MASTASPIDLTSASSRAVQIRNLYHRLEEKSHGKTWTKQEDMIGFMHDIGELGRLLMAREDRWVHSGDLPKDIADKLSECLWWVFVLSERLGVDISSAFTSRMAELESDLSESAKKEAVQTRQEP